MLSNKLRRFDLYTKPVEDCRVKTSFGGIITLVSFLVIVLLFITETWSFFTMQLVEQLYVDSTSADQQIEISFDITLPKLACALVTIDLMSQSGDNKDSIKDDVFKQRLDQNGKVIEGSKPEKQAVNTNINSTESPKTRTLSVEAATERFQEEIEQCKNDAVLRALSQMPGEGCRLWGKLNVGKITGNFHIAPGVPSTHSSSHFHDFHSLSPGRFNTSHTINHLSFGQHFPGRTDPLDGRSVYTDKGGIMHQYQLKIVPTRYVRNGETIESHQFSITMLQKDIMGGAGGIPGIFIQYEFSPLMVQYEERHRSLSFFLVSLCAIVGGVHTVASLIDALLYSTQRALQIKGMAGKFS
ncbi:hypothetical protein Mgra_00009474 [Meloidogyne graminicola]|uniref:Endoplasmic reticulum-Golgi intermediate compartment protein 3 n=1 Tax=Meloidogyne graminicola TaxID=189291 RepID=A0A8S9Z9U5_9BILA|nr:hypothetical protein Mgra_00009474 [Meloidogyne graminicola]